MTVKLLTSDEVIGGLRLDRLKDPETKSARNRSAFLLPGVAEMLSALPKNGGLVFLTAIGTKYRNNLIRQMTRSCADAGRSISGGSGRS
jgi:hypothetical protein